MCVILKLISDHYVTMTSAMYLDWNDLDITDVSPQFNDRLHAGNSLLNILVNQVSPVVNQSNRIITASGS